VHLNFPFREPLIPSAQPAAGAVAPPDIDTWPSLSGLPDADLARMARMLGCAGRGLIICGPQDDPSLASAVTELADRLQWPLLADALSDTRCGPHHAPLVIDSYDTFLRDADTVKALEPDLIVRFGAPPVSQPLLAYLEHHRACRHLLVDPALPQRWPDPTLTATDALAADPAAFCTALRHALESLHGSASTPAGAASSAWPRRWRDIARCTRAALRHGLDADSELSEPAVFDELSTLLPDGATLFAGNSMPVRDLDTFFPGGQRHIRCLANRGASGIDGVVSTALGAAAAGRHPLVLVLGDLSFYHDMNGLLAARRHDLTAVIVLLNNDGGGIFSFLPQADDPQHFEELFGTPHGLDFRPAAELYGLRYRRPADRREFRAACIDALGATGVTVIEIRTTRDGNATRHRTLWDGAIAALHTAASGGAGAGGAGR
jgi:2-succinyl-5-enolpyruvyl-6-hydroxy-3-cyclohexene-1-carboxylate synthase